MKLLIVTGMPGSGKEEFLNVAASMGMQFIRMGDIVREYHSASSSDLSVGEFAGMERKVHGEDVWAERSLRKMCGDVLLVDGCRSMNEVMSFKNVTSDVRIVAIHTSPKIRYKRLVSRGRSDAPCDFDEFVERDIREIGWGIAEVIVLSDVMIINDSSLEEFQDASKELLRSMR